MTEEKIKEHKIVFIINPLYTINRVIGDERK